MPLEIRRDVLPGLRTGLREPCRFLRVVAGPRQVGKTTLVRQALQMLDQRHGSVIAQHSVSADVGADSILSHREHLVAGDPVDRVLLQRQAIAAHYNAGAQVAMENLQRPVGSVRAWL